MKKKRVLFISPPFYRLMGSHYNGIHLGTGQIAAVLDKHGHDVLLYNADFSDKKPLLDQRKLFDNFDYYKNMVSDISHPIWSEITDALKHIKPEYIGIQMYTGTFKSAQNVADIAKSLDSKTKIVVGGTHPSLDPVGTIKYKNYDYLIQGEGEYAMLDIVNEVNKYQIKGIAFKDNDGKIVQNEERDFIEDLDSLPFPLRDKFYTGNGQIDIGAIITSRGCPFQCTYCASPQIWKKKTRYRSVENVLEELYFMVKFHNISFVRFQDDTFTLKNKHATEICEGILKKGLNLEWICDTRVDKLDKQLLELMKRAGCIRIKIGVESGSDEILKKVKKGLTKEQIRNAVDLIKAVGIPLTVYLMIGFPGETNEDVKKTIEFAEEIDAEYNSLGVIAPYYGTEMYKDLSARGFNFDKSHWEYFFHQSKEMIMNTRISPELLDDFFSLNEKGKGKRV